MSFTSVKHHYQDESVARTYDRERFASLVGQTFDRLEKRALSSILRVACRNLPAPSVLDVPCGTGRITELLLTLGHQVTGGDISEEMIDVAQERCARFGPRVAWQRLDLDGLALGDRSVDMSTCIRLFHHLETDARAAVLRELARVTRRFVIVNVSFSSPIYQFRRRLKRALGQGVSKTSASWCDIALEVASAGLQIADWRFVWPYVSEDLILLLEKPQIATRIR